MTPSRLTLLPSVLSVLVLLSGPSVAQEPAGATKQVVDLEPSFLVPQGKGNAATPAASGAVSHTPGVAFSADGKRMVTATSADELVVFDAATRKLLRRVRIPGAGHDGVSIDSKGRYAAWVLKSGGVVVVDLERGKVIARDDELETRWVAIDPAGLRIALSRGKRIEIRELRSLELDFDLEGHEGEITNLAWSADGRLLGSTAQDGGLLCHDVEKRQIRYRAKKASALHALAFAPKGDVIAYGGMDLQIYLYDFGHEEETNLAKDTAQPYWITCLGFSPDGRRLAVGDESCDIWLYDMASGKRVFHNKHHVECWLGSVAWAPDNETFVFGCRPNTHSERPAIYQALARAEAARDDEVRDSRQRILGEIEAQLVKVGDAGLRKALEEYQKFLAGEEKVEQVGAGSLFGNGQQALVLSDPTETNQGTLSAAAPSQVAGVAGGAPAQSAEVANDAVPVPQQVEIAALSQTLSYTALAASPSAALVCPPGGPAALEKLPPELRKLAEAHEALLREKMVALNEKNFCINQWKVKGE